MKARTCLIIINRRTTVVCDVSVCVCVCVCHQWMIECVYVVNVCVWWECVVSEEWLGEWGSVVSEKVGVEGVHVSTKLVEEWKSEFVREWLRGCMCVVNVVNTHCSESFEGVFV